jgi:hypothetical protein
MFPKLGICLINSYLNAKFEQLFHKFAALLDLLRHTLERHRSQSSTLIVIDNKFGPASINTVNNFRQLA